MAPEQGQRLRCPFGAQLWRDGTQPGGTARQISGSADRPITGVIVVLIMRFRRRGCFLGGFSSVNYEISTGTLGQSLLVDCVALLLFQNSRSVRQ